VLEGGYRLFGFNTAFPIFVTYDGPIPDPSFDPISPDPFDSAYKVTIFSSGGSTIEYGAFAYCLDNPPLGP
jgi:hypothetical protein